MPQGSPLSVILYLIYSSGLRNVGKAIKGPKDKTLGFIDDTAFIVVSPSIAENVEKLKKLAEEELVWAADSASKFDVVKYQLVHHARWSDSTKNKLLPLTVAGMRKRVSSTSESTSTRS